MNHSSLLKIWLAGFSVAITSLVLLSCGKSDGFFDVEELPEVEAGERVTQAVYSLGNEEAPVPPQCYTKTEGVNNPCYTCHQVYGDRGQVYRMNKLDDGAIQGEYMFSEIGVSNHWENLFLDKSDWVSSISDPTIERYVQGDNYSQLHASLTAQNWTGFIPDLEGYERGAEAFSADGFARDGSGWVAFNYKPLPSAFWPTNGSTDDVVIRLPDVFQRLHGKLDASIYQVNLALVEMNLKQLDAMDIVPVSEVTLSVDLDQDGVLTDSVSHIRPRATYVGDAQGVDVVPQQFPKDTEIMHSVRYVGVDDEENIGVSQRMKELRYMRKVRVLTEDELLARYDRERKEKMQEELPSFVDQGDEGMSNGLGWLIQGFIEDYDGQLRPQTFEEQMFCMGCHSSIGTTVDSTFSFVRKVTGVAGWGYINLKGMRDAPSMTQTEGEILQYLRRVGGGNEFRENPEMRDKWFYPDGSVKTSQVKNSDVYTLITPSPERARELNKAYTYMVRHQSYVYGRDANTRPAENVYREIDESVPPLESDHQLYGWDIQLNWH